LKIEQKVRNSILDYKKSADEAFDRFYSDGILDLERASYLMLRCNLADEKYLEITCLDRIQHALDYMEELRQQEEEERKMREADGTDSGTI